MDSSRGVKTLNEESMLIIILAFLFLLFASMNVKYGHCLLQKIMIWMLWLEI